jgi:hypothetical protein
VITEHEFGVQVHQLIKNGKFEKVDLSKVDDQWARVIIEKFIEYSNIEWSICSEKVGPASIIKLEDDYLKYMLVMAYKSFEGQKCDQFYWIIGDDPNNDDHAIHPDMANAYLLNKAHPGTSITDIRHDDGSNTTKMTMPDGRRAIIKFPKEMFDSNTWSKE